MSVEPELVQRTAPAHGVLLGALGVLGFSFSLPATRLAVDGIDPWLVAFGRAAGAGLLALAYLRVTRAAQPSRPQLRRLAIVALGVVFGFPVFTSLALTAQTAAHGAVVIALLPASTAVFAVLRAGERPSISFWLASGAGLAAVLVFVALTGGFEGGVRTADLLLLGAVVTTGMGYAEGGALARELGGARTISWALVLTLPVAVPVTLALAVTTDPGAAGWPAWLGFGYVTVVSQYLTFFAWYAGLALGGVARIGQVQLAQPVLTLLWSALLLGERVDALTVAAALAVLACVVLTQRTRERAVGVGRHG
jgi:drug/metabolite transporter (DMT)-like permease